MTVAARSTEVALRRLLHACEAQCSDADWCASPQARHSVDTAQQYASELAAAGCVPAMQAAFAPRTARLTLAPGRAAFPPRRWRSIARAPRLSPLRCGRCLGPHTCARR